jgi:S-adenosylmethionine synthetase
MYKLFTNEVVFRGHPDKVCDQISDALLDAFLQEDAASRCGIEVMGGKGKLFITGEVTSTARVDVAAVANRVLCDCGYPTGMEIINNIGVQSQDISVGVNWGGAGDNGMMFGYACDDTDKLLPKAMVILQEFARRYDEIRKLVPAYKSDGKAQITGEYDLNNNLLAVNAFTICYQNIEQERHEFDFNLQDMARDICREHGVGIKRFYINPTGRFEVGGFDGDAGLTGRKIVCDSYHGFAPVGGGAFSGKDPTKVDRSGAYKARQLACKYLKRYEGQKCLVQLSYTIGVSIPMAIYVTVDDSWVEPDVSDMFDCMPKNIIADLNLRKCNYEETARFGHFGDAGFAWELG